MRPTLAAAAVTASLLVLAACQDKSPSAPSADNPQFSISDGAHSAGNPDFFFLPPMVGNPSNDPNFDAGEFNASVSPVVQICEGIATNGPSCGGTEIARFSMTTGPGSETVHVSLTDEMYAVNWHTDQFNLNTTLTYRIRVLVGSSVLGFADVLLAENRSELKNVYTGDSIPLLDGRTLPIKFRIENAALCDPPGSDNCISQAVNLTTGGNVVVPETGDRVDIPPQPSGQVETITIQQCSRINLDAPTYGPCLRITADPPLAGDLTFPATVSVCSLVPPGLPEAQEHMITLFRQDGAVITALPHAPAFCSPTTVGAREAPPRSLAEAGWRAVRGAVRRLFGSRRLYAMPMLHLGPAGETPGFSDFQLALPTRMEPLPGTDGQTAAPGETVPNPPGVRVTDTLGTPVGGVTVHFNVVSGGGSVIPDSVVSDTNGVARVTSWTLGDPGANQLRAWALGVAGPFDSMPVVPDTLPIPADTGMVFFNATAGTPAPGIVAAGRGSCSADGVMSAGEWDSATTVTFAANLPEGGTTPATLYVMNDSMDLCLALRFHRASVDSGGNSLSYEFDANHSGSIDAGDDGLLVNGALGFSDEFRTPCTAGACGVLDTDFGGTTDGAGAFANDGTFDVYEMVHPLNSADDAHDISLVFGDTVGMVLHLRMIAAGAEYPNGYGDTDFPVSGFLPIIIASPPPPVLPAARFDSLMLTADIVHIGGPGVSYDAWIYNPSLDTLSVVVVQAFITQDSTLRAAGGAQVGCGIGIGRLPPLTQCQFSFVLVASNGAAGSGTLVPGAATARWELRLNGVTLDTITQPVTLASP